VNGTAIATVSADDFEPMFAGNQTYFRDERYFYCIEDVHMYPVPSRLIRKEWEKVDPCVLEKNCAIPECDTSHDAFDSIPD